MAFDKLTSATGVYSANVPIGRQIRLYECPNDGTPEPMLDGLLILGEDLVLNVDSTYSPIMNASAGIGTSLVSKFLSPIVGQVFRGATSGTTAGGSFAAQSVHVWESTSPLSFSVTVALYMDYNAGKQVMKPTRDLMKIVVPTIEDGFLLPPGPSASLAMAKAAEAMGLEGASKAITAIAKANTKFTTYKIAIGNYLYLDSVIVTRAEPILSSDTDNEGNPIWAKVRLDIQTTTACTKQMIDGFKTAKTFLSRQSKVSQGFLA